nr:isopentenyl phosphate kinase [Ardenticatena sp.]
MTRIFVKLGGSLLTDKTARYAARHDVLARLAREVAIARGACPDLELVLAHGSGSYGHVAARETGYDRERGHRDVLAYARVAAAAATLNSLVRAALLAADVPAVSLPPSASALVKEGRIVRLAWDPFARILTWGGVPLTYGDVALTAVGGTIVSTEVVLTALAEHLPPTRLILLTDVPGVFAHPPTGKTPPPLLEKITPTTWPHQREGVRGARGTDVTGGMVRKVEQMLALVERFPDIEVLIASGHTPGILAQALQGEDVVGTRITRG